MPPKKEPDKKPYVIVMRSILNSVGYEKPLGQGRTKSRNVLKKIYDELGVEVFFELSILDAESRRKQLLSMGRKEYKPKNKLPETEKAKIKVVSPKVKMKSGELRKLISNHNKLTKIKIPKGTDYAGLEKLISDAGYSIDHENKKLISTGKSKDIPLPTPDTPAQKEEKKKVREVKAVENKRQKAIKVLTDKNVKKQEKKNIVKGAVALKGLVNKRQKDKKFNKDLKKEQLYNIKNNENTIKSFLLKWNGDDGYEFKTPANKKKAIDDNNWPKSEVANATNLGELYQDINRLNLTIVQGITKGVESQGGGQKTGNWSFVIKGGRNARLSRLGYGDLSNTVRYQIKPKQSKQTPSKKVASPKKVAPPKKVASPKKVAPVKEKPIEVSYDDYDNAVRVMEALGMKEKDIDDIGYDGFLEKLVEFLSKPLPDGLGKKPLKFKNSYSIDNIGKVFGSEGSELGELFVMASEGFDKNGDVKYFWTPKIKSLPSDKKRIALINKILDKSKK